ncbi:MAG: hypothetical protein WC484_03655 [Candidatus Omnitrophota bacterium]
MKILAQHGAEGALARTFGNIWKSFWGTVGTNISRMMPGGSFKGFGRSIVNTLKTTWAGRAGIPGTVWGGIKTGAVAYKNVLFKHKGLTLILSGAGIYMVGAILPEGRGKHVLQLFGVGIGAIGILILGSSALVKTLKAEGKELNSAAGKAPVTAIQKYWAKASVIKATTVGQAIFVTGGITYVVGNQLRHFKFSASFGENLENIGKGIMFLSAIAFLAVGSKTFFLAEGKLGVKDIIGMEGVSLAKFNPIKNLANMSSRFAAEKDGLIFAKLMFQDSFKGIGAKAWNTVLGYSSHAIQQGFGWAQFSVFLGLIEGKDVFSGKFWLGDGRDDKGVWGTFMQGFSLGPLLSIFGNMGFAKVESALGRMGRNVLSGPSAWIEALTKTAGSNFSFSGFGLTEALGRMGMEKAAGRLTRFLQQSAFGRQFLQHLLSPFLNPVAFASSAWAVTEMVPLLSGMIFEPLLKATNELGMTHLSDTEILARAQDLLFFLLPQHMTKSRMFETVREKLPAREGQPRFSDEKEVTKILKENFDAEIVEQTLGVKLTMIGAEKSYGEAVKALRSMELYSLLANAGFTVLELSKILEKMDSAETSKPMADVLKDAGVIRTNSSIEELGKYTAEGSVRQSFFERLLEMDKNTVLSAISGPDNEGADNKGVFDRVAGVLGLDKGNSNFVNNFVWFVKGRVIFEQHTQSQIANAAAKGNGFIHVAGIGKLEIVRNKEALVQAFGEMGDRVIEKAITVLKSKDAKDETLIGVINSIINPEAPTVGMSQETELLQELAKNSPAEVINLLVNIITLRETAKTNERMASEELLAKVLDTPNTEIATAKINYAMERASLEAGEKLGVGQNLIKLKNAQTKGDWLKEIFKTAIFDKLAARSKNATEYLETVKPFRELGLGALDKLQPLFKKPVLSDSERDVQTQVPDKDYQAYVEKAETFFVDRELWYKNLADRIRKIEEKKGELSKLEDNPSNSEQINRLKSELFKLDEESSRDIAVEDAALFRNKAAWKGLEGLKAYFRELAAREEKAGHNATAIEMGELAEYLSISNVSQMLERAFFSEKGMGGTVMRTYNSLINMFMAKEQSDVVKGFMDALNKSAVEVERLRLGKIETPEQKATLREILDSVINKQEALKDAFEKLDVNQAVDATLRNYIFLAAMFEISVDALRKIEGKEKESQLGIAAFDNKSGFVFGKKSKEFEDRPFADFFGRGDSSFLIAVGLEKGFDVSAGTGIGKTRGAVLAAAFYNANHKTGDEKGVGIFLQNEDAVAKHFGLEIEKLGNVVIYEQIAACLGIRIINANDYVANGKNEYAALLKVLRDNPNAVLIMDIITRTHLANTIKDKDGKKLHNFIKKLGRQILDEVQIPAFSMVEAIIADGNRPKYAGPKAIRNGVNFYRLIQEKRAAPEEIMEMEYSAFRNEFGKEITPTTMRFAIAADGTVHYSKALRIFLESKGAKFGFGRYADFSSIFRVLFGSKQLAAETIINGLVTHKPTDGETLQEQQQSSDVALQIAVLCKFLEENREKDLADIPRLQEKAQALEGEADANKTLTGGEGILEKGSAENKWKIRRDTEDRKLGRKFAVNEANGVIFDANGRVESIDIDLVSKWYDIQGIGRLRTKMGTPIQSSFVKGVVGLSATLPEAISLLTGNVRLELGQSMADLQYLYTNHRLGFETLYSVKSLKKPVRHADDTEATYKLRDDVIKVMDLRQKAIETIQEDIAKRLDGVGKKDSKIMPGNLFFLATDVVYEDLIKDAIKQLIESKNPNGEILQTLYLENKGIDEILTVELTTSADVKRSIEKASEKSLKIVIGGLRIATGHDAARADLEKMTTEVRSHWSPGERVQAFLDVAGKFERGTKAVTHMFLMGFDDQPAALVAQALGRDRSNAGIATLYYNSEIVVRNIVNAARFPDSLKDFFDRKLVIAEANLKIARDRLADLDNFVDQATDKERYETTKKRYETTVKIYEQRVTDANRDRALVIEIKGVMAAKAHDVNLLTKFIRGKIAEKGNESLIEYLNLNLSYNEAVVQSNANRSIVTTLLRNEIMTKGLLKLLEWSSAYGIPGDMKKLEDIISDYKDGLFSDTHPVIDEKGIDGEAFAKNEIQLVFNELFGKLEKEGGRRIEAGSLIEKLGKDGAGFDLGTIRRAFRLDEVEMIERVLGSGSPAFKLDALKAEAVKLENAGRFSIANTQDGSIFDFVKTIILFGDYILKSEQTRQESSEKSEKQQVQMAELTNNPETREKVLAIDSNMGAGAAGKFIDRVLKPTGWGTTASNPGLAAIGATVSQTGTGNTAQLVMGTLNNILALFSVNTSGLDADKIRGNVTEIAKFLTENGLFGTNYANQIADRLSQVAAIWGTLKWQLPQGTSLDNSEKGMELRRLLTSDHFDADLARFHIANSGASDQKILMDRYAPVFAKERRETGLADARYTQQKIVSLLEDKKIKDLPFLENNLRGYVRRAFASSWWKYQWVAARFGNFKEADPNTGQTVAMSVAAGLVAGGLTVGTFLALGAVAVPIVVVSGLVAALASGLSVTAKRWGPAIQSWWYDTVLENWIYPSGFVKRADSGAKTVSETADADAAVQSLSQVKALDADDALSVRNYWDEMKAIARLRRLSARQFVDVVKAYKEEMKKQKLADVPSNLTQSDKKGLLNRAVEKTLEHGKWRSWFAGKVNQKMSVIKMIVAAVSFGALLPMVVAQRNWGRALGMELEKLAKRIEKDEDFAGYAADMRRTSVRMSAGDKVAIKKAQKILKAASRKDDGVLRQIRLQKEYEKKGLLVADEVRNELQQLFDMNYVLLQEKAVQKTNHSGMLAGTVGKHASEMTGKPEAELTAVDIEIAIKALDPDIRMPSDTLVTALGGIGVLKNLSVNQVKEFQIAEDCLYLVNRKNGSITLEDLNNVAKEFLWLSNVNFFEALARRFGLNKTDITLGKSMGEFSPQADPETSARQRIREAVELGVGAAQNEAREKLLTAALAVASRYGKQVAEIEYAFGLGVDNKFIESTRELTKEELQKRIKDPETSEIQKNVFRFIESRLGKLEIRFDPNADTQAYFKGGIMYYNKTLIMQLNMMRRDGKLADPDKAVRAVIRAFMLHETTEADMDKLKSEMLAFSNEKELGEDMRMCKQILGWLEKSGSDGQGQIFRDFFAEYVAGTYLLRATQEEKDAVYEGMYRVAAYMGSSFKQKMGYYLHVTQSDYRDPFKVWASLQEDIEKLEEKKGVGSERKQRQQLFELCQKYISIFESSQFYFSQIDVFAFYFKFMAAAMVGDTDTALKILNHKRKENKEKKADEEQKIGDDEYRELKAILVMGKPLETQKLALAHIKNFVRGSLFLIGSYANPDIQQAADASTQRVENAQNGRKEPLGKKEKLRIINSTFSTLIAKFVKLIVEQNKTTFVNLVINPQKHFSLISEHIDTVDAQTWTHDRMYDVGALMTGLPMSKKVELMEKIYDKLDQYYEAPDAGVAQTEIRLIRQAQEVQKNDTVYDQLSVLDQRRINLVARTGPNDKLLALLGAQVIGGKSTGMEQTVIMPLEKSLNIGETKWTHLRFKGIVDEVRAEDARKQFKMGMLEKGMETATSREVVTSEKVSLPVFRTANVSPAVNYGVYPRTASLGYVISLANQESLMAEFQAREFEIAKEHMAETEAAGIEVTEWTSEPMGPDSDSYAEIPSDQIREFFEPSGKYYYALLGVMMRDRIEEAKRAGKTITEEDAWQQAREYMSESIYSNLRDAKNQHFMVIVGRNAAGRVQLRGVISFISAADMETTVWSKNPSLKGRHLIGQGEAVIDPPFKNLPLLASDMFILDRVVDPNARGRGIGASLYARAFQTLKEKGVTVVRGTTLKGSKLLRNEVVNATVLLGKEMDGWIPDTKVQSYAVLLNPSTAVVAATRSELRPAGEKNARTGLMPLLDQTQEKPFVQDLSQLAIPSRDELREREAGVSVKSLAMPPVKPLEEALDQVRTGKTLVRVAPVMPAVVFTPEAFAREYTKIMSLSVGEKRQNEAMSYAASVAGEISGKPVDWKTFDVLQSKLFDENPAYYNETNKQKAINQDLFSALQDGAKIEDFRSLVGTLVNAMIHEDVHALQDREGKLEDMTYAEAEILPTALTVETMEKLDKLLFTDNPQYAGQIDFERRLLAIWKNRVQLEREGKRDVIQIVDQILASMSEKILPEDVKISQVITEVIAYKGKATFGSILGMTKVPDNVKDLKREANRVANPQHGSTLVSQDNLREDDPTDKDLKKELNRLSDNKGFTIIVHTPADLAEFGIERISWLAWVAAALTKKQFVKLFGVIPDKNGQFLVSQCFANPLVKRWMNEMMAQKQVEVSA